MPFNKPLIQFDDSLIIYFAGSEEEAEEYLAHYQLFKRSKLETNHLQLWLEVFELCKGSAIVRFEKLINRKAFLLFVDIILVSLSLEETHGRKPKLKR